MALVPRCVFTLVVALLPMPAEAQGPDFDAEVLLLSRVEAFRRSNAAPSLEVSPDLEAIARAHSHDMARRSTLAHVFPDRGDLRTRADAIGFPARRLVQLVARDRTVDEAFEAWIESAVHRAHLLDDRLTSVGVGISRDGEGSFITVVLARATRSTESPLPPLVVEEDGAELTMSSSRPRPAAEGALELRSPVPESSAFPTEPTEIGPLFDARSPLWGYFFLQGRRHPYVRWPNLGTRPPPYVTPPVLLPRGSGVN